MELSKYSLVVVVVEIVVVTVVVVVVVVVEVNVVDCTVVAKKTIDKHIHPGTSLSFEAPSSL